MNRSFWIACLLVIFCLSSKAQGQDAEKELKRKKYTINYLFTEHISYYRPSLRMGYEQIFSDDFRLSFELGYINHNLSLFDSSDGNRIVPFRKLNGVHISVEPRFYGFIDHTFLSVSVAYHQLDDHRVEDLWRHNFAFIQEMDFLRTEKTGEIMLHAGGRIVTQTRFSMGASFGLGVRFVQINNDLPDDAFLENRNFLNPIGGLIDGNHRRPNAKIKLFFSFTGG